MLDKRPDSELDLLSLRILRAALRSGSLSAAAVQLRVPKSTVSKRLADLEADLGVRLIERTTRRLRATTEGEVLAARADRLLGEADDIRRALSESGSAPRGNLRIAVPPIIGHLLMGDIAARFRRRHPEITLEVLFLDRPPDLLEEGFDGAIRVGELDDSTQVARRLMTARSRVVAAPSLPGIDALRHPRDLADLPLVANAPGWPGGWPLSGPGGETFHLTHPPVLSLGSTLAVRDAVVAGAGVAMMPELIAAPEIATGRLVPLLPGWGGTPKPIWFVYPSPQSATARLRCFIEALVEELADDGTAA